MAHIGYSQCHHADYIIKKEIGGDFDEVWYLPFCEICGNICEVVFICPDCGLEVEDCECL